LVEFFIFGPEASAAIKLYLRRTLVRSVILFSTFVLFSLLRPAGYIHQVYAFLPAGLAMTKTAWMEHTARNR